MTNSGLAFWQTFTFFVFCYFAMKWCWANGKKNVVNLKGWAWFVGAAFFAIFAFLSFIELIRWLL